MTNRINYALSKRAAGEKSGFKWDKEWNKYVAPAGLGIGTYVLARLLGAGRLASLGLAGLAGGGTAAYQNWDKISPYLKKWFGKDEKKTPPEVSQENPPATQGPADATASPTSAQASPSVVTPSAVVRRYVRGLYPRLVGIGPTLGGGLNSAIPSVYGDFSASEQPSEPSYGSADEVVHYKRNLPDSAIGY